MDIDEMLKKIKKREGEGEHWLTVSDLMAGLMMVFLFISISYMRMVMIEKEKIQEIAIAYLETQQAIYKALEAEFSDDLDVWGAELERESLTVRFNAPEVLFQSGSYDLTPKFRGILDDFFPRYIALLEPFETSIDEIRLEGHTSSIWSGARNELEAYFYNMDLSQGRTRSLMHYVFQLPGVDPNGWVKEKIAAVGYSSSRAVVDADGLEDEIRSRRVTFRVMTNAETQIQRIIME